MRISGCWSAVIRDSGLWIDQGRLSFFFRLLLIQETRHWMQTVYKPMRTRTKIIIQLWQKVINQSELADSRINVEYRKWVLSYTYMKPSSVFLYAVIRKCLNVWTMYLAPKEERQKELFILLFKKWNDNVFLSLRCLKSWNWTNIVTLSHSLHGWSWNPTNVQRCSMEAPTPNRALRNICGCASITDDSTSEQRSPRVRFSIWWWTRKR